MGRGKRPQGRPEAAETSTAAALEPAKKGKRRPSGCLSQLILQAFETGLPRKGLTLAALKKSLAETGFNVSKNNGRLKRELRALVSNGLLVRVTGSGVSGTFKRGRAARKPSKSEKRKAKKAAAAQRASPKSRKPKKSRKKQPAVTKPKGLQSRASAAGADRKRQVNKPQAAKKPG